MITHEAGLLPDPPPSNLRRRRWLTAAFVVGIGTLSAEHFAASQPTGALNPLLWLSYGPYFLLLVAILERRGSGRWLPLYITGALIGLGTESFVTHVLWTPPESGSADFADFTKLVFGWSPFMLLLLVPLWHPLMSVLVPMIVGRTLFGIPGTVRPISRRMAVAICLIVPIFDSTQGNYVFAAFTLPNIALLTLVWVLLRRAGGPVPLNLGRKGIAGSLIVMLGLDVLGFFYGSRSLQGSGTIQGSNLPTPEQWIPAALGLIVLAALLLRVTRPGPQIQTEPVRPPSAKAMLLYGLYAAVIDAILTLGLQILPIGSLIIAAIFIGWMPLMATLLIRGRKKGVIVSAPG